MEVIFTVYGEPQGKARPRVVCNRFTGKTVAYTPEKTKDYEETVKEAFREEAYNQRLNVCCPFGSKPIYIGITAAFRVPITTKRNKKEIISGEILPTKKPDCDNIAKIICDALNGVAYDDDKQIVALKVTKIYSAEPRVLVWISDNKIFWEEKE